MQPMDIGLFDLDWEGHHTPYAKLTSKYLKESDHSVTFFTDPQHDRLQEFKSINDVEVVTTPTCLPYQDATPLQTISSQGREILQHQRALSYANKAEIDIFHHLCLDYSQIPFYLSVATVSSLPPVVATLHRDHFVNGPGRNPLEATFDRFSIRSLNSLLACGSISMIFVHSEGIRARLISELSAANESNIVSIPCPTPDVRDDITQHRAREKLNLDTNSPLLLFFGGLRRNKGVDIFLRALEEFEGCTTAVIAGPAHDVSEDIIDEYEGAPGVRIVDHIGYVPEDQVDLYFIAADALILPYRRKKGISGPLRRACMSETHIIGPNGSDIGNIIEANNLGQTFDRGSVKSLKRTLEEFIDNVDDFPTNSVQDYGEMQHWTESGKAMEDHYTAVTNG